METPKCKQISNNKSHVVSFQYKFKIRLSRPLGVTEIVGYFDFFSAATTPTAEKAPTTLLKLIKEKLFFQMNLTK